MKIWHYSLSGWEKQEINIGENLSLVEIIDHLTKKATPVTCLTNGENFISIFEIQDDVYAVHIICSELQKLVIVRDLPSLFNFMVDISSFVSMMDTTSTFVEGLE